MQIKLGAVPAVGLRIEVQPKGIQEWHGYELVAVEPYVRKDGAASQLLVWRGSCRVCGSSFDSKVPLAKWPELRTCEEHRPRSYAQRK